MCKEDKQIIEISRSVVEENKKRNSKGQYTIMRKGKTRRDKERRVTHAS